MTGFYPDGVIIDGALPRTPKERCHKLLAHCEDILAAAPPRFGKHEYKEEIDRLTAYVDIQAEDDHLVEWNEIEADICQLMADGANSLELSQYHVYVGDPDPGDVVIRETMDAITLNMLTVVRNLVKGNFEFGIEPIEEIKSENHMFSYSFLFTDDDQNDFIIAIQGPDES